MNTLLITLERLALDTLLNTTGQTLTLTTLVLPRPGIQQRTALKTFHLQRGKAALSRKPFSEKALLKEKVEGRFGLTFQLTRPVAQPELQSWLRDLASLGLEAAGDLLASGLSATVLRPLLREPFDALADQVSEDAPEFILRGELDLDSESVKSGKLSLPLQLTESIRHHDLPPGPKAREKRKRATKSYKKGLTIGEAVLKVEIG